MNDLDICRFIFNRLPLWEYRDDGFPYLYDELGTQVLTDSEARAEALADLLKCIVEDSSMVLTGYYDPEEDRRSGETDEFTGYWFVNVE